MNVTINSDLVPFLAAHIFNITFDVNLISLDCIEFINITKVASLFARESAGSITISVTKNGEISITSVASQMGENTSTAKVTTKGSGEVTLNSRYLLDALNSMTSKEVSMRFSGKVNPVVLTPVSKQKADYQHVIMPLKS